MKNLILLFVFLLITGCASHSAPVQSTNPVPADDIFEGYHEYSQRKDGAVRVIVARGEGSAVGGTWMPVKLSINGVAVAEFRRSQRLELFMMPGDYIVALQGYPLIENLVTQTDVHIKSGERYAFGITYNVGDFLFKQSTLPQ